MKPYLKYALISFGISSVLTLISFLTGLDKSNSSQYFGWASLLLSIVFMVMCVKETRILLYSGFITFGQAFRSLLSMVVISSLLTGIFMYLYLKVINPSLIEYTREQQALEMEKQGLSQEAIDKALSISENFTSPEMMALTGLLGGIIIGIILALIISAIMKKENPELIV